MKKTAQVFALGLVFTLTMAIGSVQASSDKLKNVSCEQFLLMDEYNQNAIVYWIDGIETATDASENSVSASEISVGYDAFGNPVAEVVDACTADKKASLRDKIKKHFSKKKK
jgi:hypothetical protein